MKFLDRDHPFFDRPLTRWLTTLIPIAREGGTVDGRARWAILFGAAGLFAGWEFFIRK
ncbi:MAG: hypothetical protein IPL38_11305 [Rhodobacter sp.]|nr:hypothetical protein [Rhodobacter sp.]